MGKGNGVGLESGQKWGEASDDKYRGELSIMGKLFLLKLPQWVSLCCKSIWKIADTLLSILRLSRSLREQARVIFFLLYKDDPGSWGAGGQASCPDQQLRASSRGFYRMHPLTLACLQWEEKCLPGSAWGNVDSKNSRYLLAYFTDGNSLLPLNKAAGQLEVYASSSQPPHSCKNKFSVSRDICPSHQIVSSNKELLLKKIRKHISKHSRIIEGHIILENGLWKRGL